MTAPLCDSRGNVRYFIGAQVDVSGLVRDCVEMESLQRLVLEQSRRHHEAETNSGGAEGRKDEFQELSEMLNMGELDTVRRWGGRMHREQQEDEDEGSSSNHGASSQKPRLLLKEPSPDLNKTFSLNRGASGNLSGVYQHVRVAMKFRGNVR